MEHGILLSGADNIDFMIHGVFKYSFFGHEVWITTTHVCVLIVMLLIIGFAIAANRQMAKAREVPEGFQNVVELIVEKLDAMVDAPMGKAAPKFYNYIGTIFIFILVSNISGLLGLRPPTADYGVTLPLGVLTFLLIHYNQFKYQKPKEIWEGMCSPLPPWLPIWLPINLISEIAVPISLSLRLFANVRRIPKRKDVTILLRLEVNLLPLLRLNLLLVSLSRYLSVRQLPRRRQCDDNGVEQK